MAPSALAYQEGELLAGKYRIEGILGRGGMAVVYAAQHQMLARAVALKVIGAESGTSVELMQRFINEARAVARLKSEHVVRVMDVGVLEDGAPYIVMERLVGLDLARSLEVRGELPVSLAVDYVLQALEALAEAHRNGIVHRDLKPGNLFLADDGRTTTVKVLDFGIFKAMDGFSGPMSANTSTSAILGTPSYMSPEQLRSSKAVDARTDIWSMGVVLYELLAGALPFGGETVGGVFASVLESAPPRLDASRPGVPSGLARVVDTCLQKDRDRRYSSVVELAVALLPYAPPSGAPLVERIRMASMEMPSAGSSVTPDDGAASSRSRPAETAATWTHVSSGGAPARPATWLTALLGTFAAALILGVVVFARRSVPAPATSPIAPEPASASSAPPPSTASPAVTASATPPATASAEPAPRPTITRSTNAGPAPVARPPSRPTTHPAPAASPGLSTDRHW